MRIRFRFLVIAVMALFLLVAGCENLSSNDSQDPEPLRLAMAWCDCVDEHRADLVPENISQLYGDCFSMMMDSSEYFVVYYKNMGEMNTEIPAEESEKLLAQYGKFIDLRDSLCPVYRIGDSLVAPRNYW